ncbi:MAG: hypothetical protein NC339_06770 [Muribaculaceae bacterium]|nr:hypothetical protein [Muribaculaceae bacterium]
MRVMRKSSDDTYLLLNENESQAYFPSFTGFLLQLVLTIVLLGVMLGLIWLAGIILEFFFG